MTMAIKDLITKKIGNKPPIKRSEATDPFDSLHREINRVFENFSRGFMTLAPFSTDLFSESQWGAFNPKVDIRESAKEMDISAELPGMDEKDVQVSLTNNALVIRGEKKAEKEEKGKEWHRVERSYGSFYRAMVLPEGLDTNKAEATFKKGILHVIVPKRAGAKQETKKIAVRRT
jgi:HSP20 family protein